MVVRCPKTLHRIASVGSFTVSKDTLNTLHHEEKPIWMHDTG
jgi:hypothetical protein